MAQITRPIEGIGGTGPVTTARPRARRMRALDDSRFFPVALLVPILVFFVVWNIIPLLWLVGVSFYRFKLTSAQPATYVGMENFRRIFDSSVYW